MKKFVVIIFTLFCISLDSQAQLRVCGYFDGYWSSWVDVSDVQIYGNYEGFILYNKSEGPWDYRFKFTIDNFKVPNKKQRKKDIKSDTFYTFSGTVEYYISDDNPSVLFNFRNRKGPCFIGSKLDNGRPTKKITSKATIKVAPFKDVPTTYNIWFDGVALGINLNTIRFSHDVKYE